MRPETTPAIPGYAFRSPSVPKAPLSLDELATLRETVLLGPDDVAALREAKPILAPRVEEILDVWYGFVADHPHLLDAFVDRSTGEPDAAYLAAVRRRFGQWILDTCDATYDAAWLDWQMEIGRRHHRSGKNATDGANAAEHVPLRYLLALVSPISVTVRPFLEESGADREDVDRMHEAWRKAVLLQAILWSYPYATPGDF